MGLRKRVRCKRHKLVRREYPHNGFVTYAYGRGKTRQAVQERCVRCGAIVLRDCTTGKVVYR